jgi:hypothetical protein
VGERTKRTAAGSVASALVDAVTLTRRGTTGSQTPDASARAQIAAAFSDLARLSQ